MIPPWTSQACWNAPFLPLQQTIDRFLNYWSFTAWGFEYVRNVNEPSSNSGKANGILKTGFMQPRGYLSEAERLVIATG